MADCRRGDRQIGRRVGNGLTDRCVHIMYRFLSFSQRIFYLEFLFLILCCCIIRNTVKSHRVLTKSQNSDAGTFALRDRISTVFTIIIFLFTLVEFVNNNLTSRVTNETYH